MDEDGFKKFLKRGGRSQIAIRRCIKHVADFANYLRRHRHGTGVNEVSEEDLESYVEWIESELRTSAKIPLWALSYYYEFTSHKQLQKRAGELRQQRIRRTPFKLRKFRGINPEYAEKLAAIGIENVKHMLNAGRTHVDRQRLSRKTGIPAEAILEFVKLSDLARIGAVRGIRARLYYDAGIDTVDKVSKWDPEELREYVIEFVQRTGFKGIAPLPKEARNTVEDAKKLPRVVEY